MVRTPAPPSKMRYKSPLHQNMRNEGREVENDEKLALGEALIRRMRQCGYPNQQTLADQAGIARRTIGPLLAGTWTSQPSVKSLNALDEALRYDYGTLVAVVDNADLSLLRQPVRPHPANWLTSQFASRGIEVDPDQLRDYSRGLGAIPAVADILDVLASALDTQPAPANRGHDQVKAARTRRKRPAASASQQGELLTA